MKALLQVGLTGEQKLQWALRFADESLGMLTAPDWMSLSLQFSTFGLSQDMIESLQLNTGNLIGFPTQKEIALIHKRFNVVLKLCDSPVADDKIAVIGSPVRGDAMFLLARFPSGRYELQYRAADLVNTNEIALLRLLEEYGGRVRTCPKDQDGWGKRFLATRADNKYCSATCVNRSTTRRHRARRKANEEGANAKR